MSGTYYCHECQVRRPMILTPRETCSVCGCQYIEEIPIVLDDDLRNTTDEEDFNREIDFFFFHEREEDNADMNDEEELLEERCLYEHLSSVYNRPIARNSRTSLSSILNQQRDNNNNNSSSSHPRLPSIPSMGLLQQSQSSQEQQVEEEDEIIAYDVLFQQTRPSPNFTSTTVAPTARGDTVYNRNQRESTSSSSIFEIPFSRIGRLLDTMYSYDDEDDDDDDDEEEEEGGVGHTSNYHRRSFLDSLADILFDEAGSNIPLLQRPAARARATGPSIDVILNSLKKEFLPVTDPDIDDECIICQEVYSSAIEIFYLPCHHKFHGTCISEWLNIKTSCPICRRPVHHEIRRSEEEEEEEEEEVIQTSIGDVDTLATTRPALQLARFFEERFGIASSTQDEDEDDDINDRLSEIYEQHEAGGWISSSASSAASSPRTSHRRLNSIPPTNTQQTSASGIDEMNEDVMMLDWTRTSMEDVD